MREKNHSMKRLAKSIGLSALLSLNISSALAVNGKPLVFWDNTQGLTFDNGCKVEATDKVPFYVSQYSGKGNSDTENLRNYNGVRQSHLINFSVVKDRIGASKRDYKPISVVGINERSEQKAHRWTSKRGDSGYLYEDSLRPMEDFVFGVKLEEKNIRKEILRALPQFDANKNIFLRIASGESYYKATCPSQGDKSFYVFRAYQQETAESSLLLVGISDEESSILSRFHTYGKVESKSFLPEVGNEGSILVSEESFVAAVEADPNVEDEVRTLEQLSAEVDAIKEQEENDASLDEEAEVVTSEVQTEEETPIVAETTLNQVVCIGSTTLNVRDEELDDVEFKAGLGDPVKVFQSWSGENSIKKTIDGIEYNFVKVEFPNREANKKVGYVAQRFLKNIESCPFLNNGKSVRSEPVAEITGLNDSRCCDFPTVKEPTHSYTSGMRRFSAGRSGGKRLHAACDLYRYKNEPIRSVAPGRVLRDLYYFYQGTYALEVRHDGGFVVRYGELTGKQMAKKGHNVKMGQNIGLMGKVNSNCCRPMLHFELYSGSEKGPLKAGGRYQRRSDLLNPTDYLKKWQSMVF